jgi:hypothetical protein
MTVDCVARRRGLIQRSVNVLHENRWLICHSRRDNAARLDSLAKRRRGKRINVSRVDELAVRAVLDCVVVESACAGHQDSHISLQNH